MLTWTQLVRRNGMRVCGSVGSSVSLKQVPIVPTRTFVEFPEDLPPDLLCFAFAQSLPFHLQ